ncbi:MAG: DUF4135 domain-containing protein [Candidatus Dojkabacteria bacterium]|nr:MAG: DUF4135 domain-containing protein [Candidatus Dojkabacteria bacterium]
MRGEVIDLLSWYIRRDFPILVGGLRDSVQDHLEDIWLPTLVSQYYSEKQDNFIEFIRSLREKSFSHLSGRLEEVTSDILGELLLDQIRYSLKPEVKILGDLHVATSMRYKQNNEVLFERRPYYDQALAKIIDNFFPELKDSFPAHRHADTIIYRQFIPVQIESSNGGQLRQYYYSFGKLSALLAYLRAIDVNAENIIAALPSPVLFDLECLFSPHHPGSTKYSFRSTGIVKISDSYDMSAFTGGETPLDSYLKPLLGGTVLKPQILWKVPSQGKFYNIPQINGINIHPQSYMKDLINGVNDAFKVLEKQHAKIKRIIEDNEIGIRIVLRPTREYRLILLQYYFPHIYEKNNFEEYLKQELQGIDYIYAFGEEQSSILHEIKALKKGVIPKFFAEIHSKEVITPAGDTAAILTDTPFDVWNEYTKNLSSIQKDIITSLREAYPSL